MTDWPARLTQRQRVVALANAVEAGDDPDAHDAEVNRLCALATQIEDEIFAADPEDGYALGTQVQLAVTLWNEQCPLEPRVQALLEGVAAALILTPVPIFPAAEARRVA